VWGKIKRPNGKRGPGIGMVEGLRTFCTDFQLAIGRALVKPDLPSWQVPLIVSNPNSYPVTIPAWTRMATVESIAAIQSMREPSIVEDSQSRRLPEHLSKLVRDNQDLTPVQQEAVRSLLGDYEHLFPSPGTPLTGQTSQVLHDIDTGSTRPIKVPLRRLSPEKIKVQDELVHDMLKGGQIETSESPWAFPTVLIKKKDGTMRFCVDYRRLNKVTRKDAFPLPMIEDSLNMLAGQQWFCSLDLASGYWQVQLSPEAKEKTAFATQSGLYQFRVMPFGRCNAPATFERLMSQVLRGLQWERCLIYIDDILIFGATFAETLDNLQAVLMRISQFGLQLKTSKCELFQTELPFLGHIVGRNGLSCDPQKIQAVTTWTRPSDIKDIRQFLGFCGYYRRFVPDFAEIAYPLTRLTKKDIPFIWSSDCQLAFKKLIQLLTTAPVLAFPRPDLEYLLDTDASDFGLGGVLSQVQNGQECVIAYYSHSLRESQQKYCTTKRELLALISSMLHFSGYLKGPRFVTRTDHAALVWLHNLQNCQGMMARWLSLLGQFHFHIEHRSGAQHGNADALSRCKQSHLHGCCGLPLPTPDPSFQPFDRSEIGSSMDADALPVQTGETWLASLATSLEGESIPLVGEELWIHSITAPTMDTFDPAYDFQTQQGLDSDIKQMCSWIITKSLPNTQKDLGAVSTDLIALWLDKKRLFVCSKGLLWRKRSRENTDPQLLVPKQLRHAIFLDHHAALISGHMGIDRTHARISALYYWPGLSDMISREIFACPQCSRRKSPPNRKQPMGHVHSGTKFARIAMDLLDVTTISDGGKKYILVVADYFTKYTEAYALENKTAFAVAEALMDNWLTRYGFPLTLHSDQGKEFENKVILELCQLLGCHKTKTSPYRPQSDGLVERMNRTLLSMLAMFVNSERTNWDDLLPFLMMAYNTSVHDTTGYTPYFLVFGEECNLPGSLVHHSLRPEGPPKLAGDYTNWVRAAIYTAYDEVRGQQQRATQRQKRYYDTKAVSRDFPLGSWVLRYYPPKKQHKLGSPWTGPWKVVRNAHGWTVGIQKSALDRVWYIHRDDLKPCAPPEDTSPWDLPLVPGESTKILESLVASSIPPLSISAAPTVAMSKPDEHVITLGIPLSRLHVKSYLDYKGFRYSTMVALYLAIMADFLQHKDTLGRISKHARIVTSLSLVSGYFKTASPKLQASWIQARMKILTEIVCLCVIKDPTFKAALLELSTHRLSEILVSDLLDIIPDSAGYMKVLLTVQGQVHTSAVPPPTWAHISKHYQATCSGSGR